MTDRLWDTHAQLRNEVYKRFRYEWNLKLEWKDHTVPTILHLSWLCGRGPENRFALGVKCTPEEVRFCEALLGPHGYAVYKARVAQLEGSQDAWPDR